MFQALMWIVFGLLAGSLTAVPSQAEVEEAPQKSVQRIVIGGGDVFMIPELAAAVVDDSGSVIVRVMPPADRLPKGMQKLDIKAGDEILMINGKRVKNSSELKELYEAVEVGEEVSLGLKRGGSMHIASFKKADPETLPKRQMMIQTGGPGDHPTAAPRKVQVIKMPGTGEVEILGGARLIVAEKDGGLIVVGTLPEAESLYKVDTVKDGDIIVSVQGKPIVKARDFTVTYDAIKVGERVALVLSRDGKTIKVSFDKPVETDPTFLQK